MSKRERCNGLANSIIASASILCAVSTLRCDAATVTNCSESDLRSALSQGGDVKIECGSMITLTSPISIFTRVSISAAGSPATISGRGARQIFHVLAGASLSLSNVVLANGHAATGGAIYNEGEVQLSDCVLSNNLAEGRFDLDGYLGMNPLSVFGDHGSGGAIANFGTLKCVDSLLISNTALGGPSVPAGIDYAFPCQAVYCNYAEQFPPSAFGRIGGAGRGAAIYNLGETTILNSIITNNRAVGGAGGGPGGWSLGSAICSLGGTVTLDSVSICGNLAQGGDGITTDNRSNSLVAFVSGRGGDVIGGMIYANETTMAMRNCHVNANVSMAGNAANGKSIGAGTSSAGSGGFILGGMAMVIGSSGVYSNVSFFGNEALASRGGNGALTNSSTTFLAHGGPGGDAYGGVVFVAQDSRWDGCTFINHTLQAGSGGMGGVGSTRGGDGGKADGGAIYCVDPNTIAVFANCVIATNRISSGVAGVGMTNGVPGIALGVGVFNADATVLIDGTSFQGNLGAGDISGKLSFGKSLIGLQRAFGNPGTWKLILVPPFGVKSTLQFSTNLIKWSIVQEFASTNLTAVRIDDSFGPLSRFYRIH